MFSRSERETGFNVAILADLQGPKIRIGKMKEGGAVLVNGSKVEITTQELIGDENRIYITYENFPNDVEANEIILLDDGKLQLRVLETNHKDTVTCEVVHGGVLTSRKGVNLPNTKVSIPSLTEEDLDNLNFALDHGVDWIAAKGSHARIIAKIEKPEAIENIDAIIEATDAVMVARGDLGVELPMEEVPGLQKIIVQKCRDLSKPVIIATQMLESMINNSKPTRAEVSDIANAIYDGTSCIMLSRRNCNRKISSRMCKYNE